MDLRLLSLALAIFAANMGLSVIFPLIPHLAGEGAAGAHAVGWIFSSYALMLVLAQVVGGSLADRFSAKRVLTTALWLYFLSLLGFAVARSVGPLMAMRAIEGLAVGLVIPCVMKLVVAGSPPERLGRSIGTVMGLGGVGFLIGPVLGAQLAGFGLATPFLAAALVAAAAAITTSLTLPASQPDAAPAPWPEAVREDLGHLGKMIGSAAFLALVLPLVAVKINFATLQAGLPLFGEAVLGADMTRIGLLFVVTAVAYAVVQPFAGRLADRHPTGKLAAGAIAALAALLIAMAFLRDYGTFLGVYALFSVAQSMAVLFAMKHLGDAIGEGATGRSFGLAAAIGDTGMILAPSLLLPLYAWKAEGLFLGLAGVMALVLALFLVLSAAWRAAPAPPAQKEAL